MRGGEIDARRSIRKAEAEIADMTVAMQAFPWMALNYVVPWLALSVACWWLRMTWKIKD